MIDTKFRTGIVATIAALALAGCSNIGDAIGDRIADEVGGAVEGQIENAIEAELGEDAEVSFGSDASLPRSFPESIPVPDGAVITAFAAGGTWTVSIDMDDPSSLDAIGAQLQAQGYEIDSEFSQPNLDVVVYAGPEYQVSLGLLSDGDESFAQITVTTIEGDDAS